MLSAPHKNILDNIREYCRESSAEEQVMEDATKVAIARIQEAPGEMTNQKVKHMEEKR